MHSVASGFVRLLAGVAFALQLASCGGGGSDASTDGNPNLSQPTVASIEIAPSHITFTASGQSMPLKVKALDKDGVEITGVKFLFSSSDPAIEVSDSGNVQAVSGTGSASITAKLGEVSSLPITAAAVSLQPSVIPIDDSMVVSAPTGGAGGTYEFAVSDGTGISVGSLVVGTGAYRIGGRITKIQPFDTAKSKFLFVEPTPVTALVKDARLSFRMTGAQIKAYAKSSAGISAVAEYLQTQEPMRSALGVRANGFSAAYGRLTCDGDFDAAFWKPTFNPTTQFDYDTSDFVLDGSILSGVVTDLRFRFSGTAHMGLDGALEFQPFTGRYACRALLVAIPIPVTGLLALVISPIIPIDAIAKGEARLGSKSKINYDFKQDVNLSIGLAYTEAAGWSNLSGYTTSNGSATVTSDAYEGSTAEWELRAGVGAGLGVRVLARTLTLIEAQVETGLVWRGTSPIKSVASPPTEPATETFQSANITPGSDIVDFFRDNFKLNVDYKAEIAKITTSTGPVLNKATLGGAATLSRSSFSVGDASTFFVALDPASLNKGAFGIGSYDIDEVRIYRVGLDGVPTKVASAKATAANSSQFQMEWQSDFVGGSRLPNEKAAFHAFVVPKFLSLMRDVLPIYLGPVASPPSITIQPATVFLSGGPATASFSVGATAESEIEYQWRRNGINIPDATASTYTFPATQADDGAQFDVVVKSAGLSTESKAATLSVRSGVSSGLSLSGEAVSFYPGFTMFNPDASETVFKYISPTCDSSSGTNRCYSSFGGTFGLTRQHMGQVSLAPGFKFSVSSLDATPVIPWLKPSSISISLDYAEFDNGIGSGLRSWGFYCNNILVTCPSLSALGIVVDYDKRTITFNNTELKTGGGEITRVTGTLSF
ncbi:immunoglobulin domain-containing protein [Paucibacter sp. XJ19-41]|uniref:immunoglobulin domain-containing protein n=1 Tax=Paucibacter sp. XJ19-41 TaxID=2927824 RepID=UPI00234A8040|nr:immunoglobulin domain-containing protein [Paucibacter sp. XJ19-41]MDC6166484.1 immunoglobulin domain-containing protein [Paucibacter sp. XJ19-41]